jgi:hypothetical protein
MTARHPNYEAYEAASLLSGASADHLNDPNIYLPMYNHTITTSSPVAALCRYNDTNPRSLQSPDYDPNHNHTPKHTHTCAKSVYITPSLLRRQRERQDRRLHCIALIPYTPPSSGRANISSSPFLSPLISYFFFFSCHSLSTETTKQQGTATARGKRREGEVI